MMLSKKNSEALENFSEKLEVEGRSLWQDARRRFMHNRAAVASLIVLLLIALFVTLAPMLSQFSYFDTDWGMMSSAPDMESGHYFGTDSSGRDLLVRVAIGGRISLMVGIAAALVAVSANRDPTDRSIPDVRITSVIPTAIMALTDVCCRMFNRLLTVKKFGLMVETIAISTSRAINDFCSINHALVK